MKNFSRTGSITIKDIAKALNLAPSSVTRALKGNYKISEATIQKVQAYAKEHNYRPNLIAQSLKNQRSRSIGVMLSSIPNNFYAEVINGIESVAGANDYHIMISQSHESSAKEVEDLKHLTWKAVDGLLVSLAAETDDVSHFEDIIAKGIPVVFFDRVPEGINTHKVVVDNKGGTYTLTKHLLDQGFKRIAHITSAPTLSITKGRLEGYRKALDEAGVRVNEEYIKYCSHGGRDDVEVQAATDSLLMMKSPPDAVITASDRITLKTFSSLQEKGISIPTQIALGGFSNFSAPQLFYPPLTTLTQPAFEMGKTAMELLLQLVEAKRVPKEFQTIALPTTLTVRESSLKKAGM